MSTMEFNVPMDSQWDYEPNNIHIYEKEFHDYVVYYVVQGDSQLFLSNLEHTSGTSTENVWKV